MKKNRNLNYSRRKFFKSAGIGAVSITGLPFLASACSQEEKIALNAFFSQNDTLVFQGDSITDAGREKKNEWANNGKSLGTGYAMLVAAKLLGSLPEKNLNIYNRGISGNKVYQLQERWKKDCIELKPDVLSILIGVNDYWHMRNGKYDGTPEIYEKDYRKLLNDTKTALPDTKLIICQPFILANTRAVDDSWVKSFSAYQEIADRICKEFDAIWVPFQEAFTEATARAPETYWTADGVHPSTGGAQLMADTWLKSLARG
ncbi:SGNH/GDSL hydrolase family protein [Bacteroidota bacterium]